jgi:hypothetical protein
MKTQDKLKAIELRKNGYSFREISEKLAISKSTASLWTRVVILNDDGKKRLRGVSDLGRLRSNLKSHEKKLKRLQIAEREANELLNQVVLNKDSALIALSIMYWCEGAKRDNSVSFHNSDPNLLKAFINILIEVFGVDRDKIKIKLQLHDYHDHKELTKFWSEKLDIPKKQFTKVYEKVSDHKYSSKDYKGCVRISYYNSHIARVILSFAKNFIKLYI